MLFFQRLCKSECQAMGKRNFTAAMLSRSLSSAKIVQGECKVWENAVYHCYAEPQPIFCKDSARRMQSMGKRSFTAAMLSRSLSSAKIVQARAKDKKNKIF